MYNVTDECSEVKQEKKWTWGVPEHDSVQRMMTTPKAPSDSTGVRRENWPLISPRWTVVKDILSFILASLLITDLDADFMLLYMRYENRLKDIFNSSRLKSRVMSM